MYQFLYCVVTCPIFKFLFFLQSFTIYSNTKSNLFTKTWSRIWTALPMSCQIQCLHVKIMSYCLSKINSIGDIFTLLFFWSCFEAFLSHWFCLPTTHSFHKFIASNCSRSGSPVKICIKLLGRCSTKDASPSINEFVNLLICKCGRTFERFVIFFS